MLVMAVTLFSVTACDSDDAERQDALSTPGKLYLPRDQYAIDLATGQSVTFEWENSKTDKVSYQVLFDREDGDFSDPVYVITSNANGFFPALEVPATTLTTIAALSGGLPGHSIAIKWTVRTIRGLDKVTGVEEGGSRTLLLTRPNTIDPLPVTVAFEGTATENQAAVALNAALPISSTKGKYIGTRQAGAMECFTKFTAGTFTVQDDLERYFALEEGGTMKCSFTEPTNNQAPAEGIYWVYLDFNTMTWSMKEIKEVALWTHPHFAEEDMAPMTYEGNGVWALVDYAWKVGTPEKKDTRYHFIVTYADKSIERWSYFKEDCRPEDNPETDPLFFNVYRFGKMDDAWAHSWKSKGDSEGVGMLATFRVYMNNVKSGNYIHERSFKN